MDTLMITLCNIKNAQQAKKSSTKVPFSKVSWRILQILFLNGYVEGFTLRGKSIFIFLRYFNSEKTIKKIQRISSSTKRVFTSWKKLNTIQRGLGLSILSTPKGLMSDRTAREVQIGGEILCSIF